MTLGRRVVAPRITTAVPALGDTTPAPAENGYDGYIRGVSDLPPVIPNIGDRPIIQPVGRTHWKDIPVARKGRRPASVLSCLLKRYHPGIVDYQGQKILATTWEHYHAAKDTHGYSVADRIEDLFWLRYKCDDGYVDMAKQHIRRCCKPLLSSIFYYARVQAIIDHFRKVENTNMNDKLAGQYYLEKSEYVAQRQSWMDVESWAAAADGWCNREWIQMSKTAQKNRVSKKYKPHKGGIVSVTTICQRMSAKTGEEVTPIQAWVHTHKGPDENNPLILNTDAATKCLEKYTKRTKELNGENFDCHKNPVSSKGLYDSSVGKPHGRWSLLNGFVNDTEILAEVRAAGASSTSLKRRRAEQIEDELRQETAKTRNAEAYANNVLSWGVGMYEHCNGIQKLLETLATFQGVPINDIPPPPVPPPARGASPISPQCATVHILENSEVPVLSAQQPDPSYLNGHIVSSEDRGQDLNGKVEPSAEGMFGGFFSEFGSDALNTSTFMPSQPVP